MANGSKGERKQAEPEGKQTSQVRLEWGPMEGQRWVVTLPTLTLSVNPIDGGLQWSALVEVPNGADLCEYFATHEEAKQYCVEKARELLEKDLKSLGGGVQAEPAEVKS